MIEPVEELMTHGVANFKLNGMEGDFTQACVGKVSKKSTRFKHWDNTYLNIPQIAIDDFVQSKQIPYVDLLHADIQGAEYEMLLGAQKSIKENKIGYIFISTHSETLHQQCLQFFSGNNYKIIAEHSLSESYSVDGLIASCSKNKSFRKIDISRRTMLKDLEPKDLKVGQRLNVIRKPSEGGAFVALKITMTAQSDEAVIEGFIQNIDHQKNTLCLLDREFALPDGIKIRDLQRNTIGLKDLKVGDRVKLKGTYSERKGFVPKKINMKATIGFSFEMLQGAINKIDQQKRALDVVGFTVMVDERTTIF
jgi:FkbM family methyltransferase